MRKTIFLLFIHLFTLPLFSQIAGNKDFELVESIPIETNLDNPDVRNTFDVWLEMINNAKHSIDIEQFYISTQKNEPLDDIINAIINAGKRGINVRIIIDKRMYKTYPEPFNSLIKMKNISGKVIDFVKIAGSVQHSKFFVIDGREIFFGSQNFDWRALKHIHELGLRINHPEAVKIYGDIFELDWKLAETNNSSILDTLKYQKLYSTPLSIIEGTDTLIFTPTYSPITIIPDTLLWDEKHFTHLIDNAKNELMLQFLSYNPVGYNKKYYDGLDGVIRRVAARGVKVKMIVSDWEKGTTGEKHLKNLARIPNIELKYSNIPEWSGGYISYARVEHCKFIVADSKSFWLGTSNGEKSYFYNSSNLGIIVQNQRLASKLRAIFLKSWNSHFSESINPDKTYTPREHGER
jgi:phosphatidylserine/phosphatidylglycerophosphate/cardiolipin synthase-like enzyme